MADNIKSAFSRNPSTTISTLTSGVKPGPNGTFLVSTGISHLDKILGGGIPLGTLVMIMEDNEAPHHLLLLRNFMSQGLIHQQPLLYCSPEKNPHAFLGTLPGLLLSKSEKRESGCITGEAQDWEMLSFINSLRSTLRSSNAVCMVTLPPSVLSLPFYIRWQHLADILLFVKALPDEDKELSRLLTDYNEMVGLLCIKKVCRINNQVPAVLDAATFSLKLQRRSLLVLECLNQAPVDGSGNNSSDISSSCSGSSNISSLDF
ncbi:unnamed protein product [Victoria cruziana]